MINKSNTECFEKNSLLTVLELVGGFIEDLWNQEANNWWTSMIGYHTKNLFTNPF